jgi:hypothetical protein
VTAAGPHSGDDTFDLIDDALCRLAERRGKWPGAPLTAITLIASLIDQAERMLPSTSCSPSRQRHMARHRDRPRHQPRAGRAPLQPRLPSRRQQMALQLVTPLHVHMYLPLHLDSYTDSWWRIFRQQALAGQDFADPDEIAYATRVATAQLNARARPWIWGRPEPKPRSYRRRFIYTL